MNTTTNPTSTEITRPRSGTRNIRCTQVFKASTNTLRG